MEEKIFKYSLGILYSSLTWSVAFIMFYKINILNQVFKRKLFECHLMKSGIIKSSSISHLHDTWTTDSSK